MEVSVVADISPDPVSKEGGEAAMNTVLLANPDVDVALGSDSVVIGAHQALRKTDKARSDQFLGAKFQTVQCSLLNKPSES